MSSSSSSSSTSSSSYLSSWAKQQQQQTFVLLVAGALGAAVAASSWYNHNNNNATTYDSSWTNSSEPFPGTTWLHRVATSPFVHGNTTYSSIYDAVLQNGPLHHAQLSNPCRNVNAYINSIVLPQSLATWVMHYVGHLEWGHYLLTYLRNWIAANLLYFGTGAIFHYICYYHSKAIWNTRPMPSTAIMIDQIKMATASLTLYSLLPCLDEYLIENGYTKVYYTVEQVGGWTNAILCFVLYFGLVEIGIYWVHRTLHTNKFLYKYIHMPHHKYNSPATLTPWASLAFHPIDGILQASPYVIVLPLVPCHYLFHIFLLFWTAVWATYIHDSMDFGNVGPIMGSKYHTMHHTHYIYNYGQVFTFCDAFWGTLRVPIGPTGSQTKHTPAQKQA